MKHSAKNAQFEELRSLDLHNAPASAISSTACATAPLARACSAKSPDTMCEMIRLKDEPLLIYDGYGDSPLGGCSANSSRKAGAGASFTPRSMRKQRARGGNAIVVGAFSERDAERFTRAQARALFINPFDMARPGQMSDGFFPDAVFADPRFVMPVIYAAPRRVVERQAQLGQFLYLRPGGQWRPGGAGGARRKSP